MFGIWILTFLYGAAGQIPREYALDITVYHVNPLSDGVLPINMDTADALGDIFFDFRSKVLPLECAPNQSHYPLDCSNQEVVSKDLVITKLELTVDNRFGHYGDCNVCVNGSASGLKNCTNGEYVCACGGHPPKPCSKPVGIENVTQSLWHGCLPGAPDWRCWKNNVVTKTGGLWYSTTASGYCGDGTKLAPEGCTWSVKNVSKILNKTCSDNFMYNFVETYDQESSSCFAGCADSSLGPSRNTSSACWIKCFYKTLLGPDAGTPGGNITGIPKDELLTAWEKTFLSNKEEEGGCPALPPPSFGTCKGMPGDGQTAARRNEACTKDVDCKSKSRCNVNFELSSPHRLSLGVFV